MKPFKQKIEEKRKRLEAEKLIVEEKAKQVQKEKEWKDWEREQSVIAEQNKQIILKDEQRKAEEYLDWKQEQQLIREQTEFTPAEPINTGIGIGHADTWVLTWKSFSTHPDIINLPMSEKVRLFRIAERQQADKLNYYTNLTSEMSTNLAPNDQYWRNGYVETKDGILIISADITWDNDVEVRLDSGEEEVGRLTIQAGVTLTVLGTLTASSDIINYGTIELISLIQNVPIDNRGAGSVVYI